MRRLTFLALVGLLTLSSGIAHGAGTIQCTEGSTGAPVQATCTGADLDVNVTGAACSHAEDSAHTSGDEGTLMLGVRKDAVESTCGTNDDYCGFTISDHGGMHIEAQHYALFDGMEATTGWTVLGNDTITLATTVNHVLGQYALEFDKVNGTDNSQYGGIQKTITSMDLTPYIESGGFFNGSVYVSATTDIQYCLFRAGTDASNYNEWWLDDDAMSAGWNPARAPIAAPNAVVGNGMISTAVTFVVFACRFDAETDALADIAIDHISINSGLQTSADIQSSVSTSVSTPNINVHRLGGQPVNEGVGNVGNATQRVTLADDDTNAAAMVVDLAAIEALQILIEALLTTIDSDTNDIKTAVEIMDDWDDGSDHAEVVTLPPALDADLNTACVALTNGEVETVLGTGSDHFRVCAYGNTAYIECGAGSPPNFDHTVGEFSFLVADGQCHDVKITDANCYHIAVATAGWICFNNMLQ